MDLTHVYLPSQVGSVKNWKRRTAAHGHLYIPHNIRSYPMGIICGRAFLHKSLGAFGLSNERPPRIVPLFAGLIHGVTMSYDHVFLFIYRAFQAS